MLRSHDSERVMEIIESLDREQVIDQLRRCPARFPIDFTDEWLRTQPLEELRHVLAAVCIQCDVIPQIADRGPVRAA